MGLKFLQDIVNLDNIQFVNGSGTNAGLINMDGNDLVISNSQGDVLLGDGSADVFIGDGTNNVDIRFEQSGSITPDNSNATLTIGGTGSLIIESPTINSATIAGVAFTGNVNIGSNTSGQDFIAYGNATGEKMFWDASESNLTINHDDGDSGLEIYPVSSTSPTVPQLRIGRDAGQYWGVYTNDSVAHLVHRQDETGGSDHSTKFQLWTSATGNNAWQWDKADNAGANVSTKMKLTDGGVLTLNNGSNTITNTKVGQWDTAYGWGNHASAGYLTSSSTQTKYLRSDANDTATGYLTLSGGVTGANSLMTSFFLPQNPEGSHVKAPWFFNDMAYARLRGATVTVTVNGGSSPSNSQIDAMFDASTGFWSMPTSGVTSVVIELTNPPKSMQHGAHYGVTFGNTTWRANSVDIEAYYSSAYQEVVSTTSNSKEFVYGAKNSAGNSVSKIKWTFSNFNTTSMRIVSLFAYNYNATGMPSLYLTKNGGEMYGDIDMGTNTITDTKVGQWDTAYGWGNHASAGYASGDFLLKSGGTMTGNLTINNTYPRIFLTDSNSNDDWSIINNDGKFGIYNDTDTSYALTINGSNNVGIGATSPHNKAHITSSGNQDGLLLDLNTGSSGDYTGVYFKIDNNTTNAYKKGGLVWERTGSYNEGRFHFLLNNEDNANNVDLTDSKFTILSTGNVGIGTTSPETLLHLTTAMSSSPTTQLYLDVDGTNTNGGGGEIIFNTSASAGSPTSYNAKITGTRASGGTGGDSQLGFWTTLVSSSQNPQERMTITKEGNVGIGTTSPAEKLEVDGNIAVSGTVDGRDIATDGTKLDTVATNADVTPSWVPSSDPSYLTAHPNISAASSVNNSGKTHIQDITVDSNGHVTGIVSHALNSSDFVEPNSNATLNSLSCGTFTHPTDISFVLDNDNNETASFTIKDGVGNSPFTLTEAGDLTITGKFVSTYAAKASSGDILVEDSGEIKKRTPTELKTDLSLNNVPNTDATNANNLASGTVPTARLATTAIAKGGTGATSASGARAALGAAASSHTHAASDITSGTFDSNRVKQICTTHHNFFMNSSSTTTDFFIPYNNLNESSNPTNSIYYGRMVAPYDGRIVKVVLHTTAAIGTACQVLFWVATSSGTFAPSAAETVTGVNLNTANTSATATFSTNSTAQFSAEDVLGVSIIKSSSATANMQVTVVWEYTL